MSLLTRQIRLWHLLLVAAVLLAGVLAVQAISAQQRDERIRTRLIADCAVAFASAGVKPNAATTEALCGESRFQHFHDDFIACDQQAGSEPLAWQACLRERGLALPY